MASPPLRDGVLGAAIAAIWVSGVAVGSFVGWYPTSQAALWWTGAWLGTALALRRHAPRLVFWLTILVYPLTLRVGLQSGLQVLPVLVVVYGAAVAGVVGTRLAGCLGTLAVLALLTAGGPSPRGTGSIRFIELDFSNDYSTAAILVLTVWATALLASVVRRLSETVLELRRVQSELQSLHEIRTHEAVLTERNRIARELHDVVAHHISAIVMRARAAVVVADEDPAESLRAARWIAATGTEAMASMRSAVKVLRDERDTVDLAPSATLDELGTIVQRVRDAGLDVALVQPGPLPELSPAAELAILRIAQEALTNVVVHSDSARASIDLRHVEDNVVLEIRDPGPTRIEHTSGGNGLHVMHERVDACGGSLVVGPAAGGWAVRASIPIVVPA